jgi:hypothetical protein
VAFDDVPPSDAPVTWGAPLPTFEGAAITQRLRVGPHEFHLFISPVQREVPGEKDMHLVHLAAHYGGQPLVPNDLGISTPDACANAWAYLTNRLTETVVQFYSPRPRDTGENNPRLGCWGPRPDLTGAGLGDSDCALAVVIGLGIWLPGSKPPPDDEVFLEALRDAMLEALSYWVVVAQRLRTPTERRN